MMEVQGDVAAVIAEPVRWTTVDVPPAGFWDRVRESCDRHGALLVFDEVPSALGRTGRMFTCEHFGVTPDILAIGKGLGGGVMPMAAIIARRELGRRPPGSPGPLHPRKEPAGLSGCTRNAGRYRNRGPCRQGAGAWPLNTGPLTGTGVRPAGVRQSAGPRYVLGGRRTALGRPAGGRGGRPAALRHAWSGVSVSRSGVPWPPCARRSTSAPPTWTGLVILESAAIATAAQMGAGS